MARLLAVLVAQVAPKTAPGDRLHLVRVLVHAPIALLHHRVHIGIVIILLASLLHVPAHSCDVGAELDELEHILKVLEVRVVRAVARLRKELLLRLIDRALLRFPVLLLLLTINRRLLLLLCTVAARRRLRLALALLLLRRRLARRRRRRRRVCAAACDARLFRRRAAFARRGLLLRRRLVPASDLLNLRRVVGAAFNRRAAVEHRLDRAGRLRGRLLLKQRVERGGARAA